MPLEDVRKEFALKAKIMGGLFLLNAKDMLDFIARAESVGISVLGVEGFTVNGCQVQPHQEHTYDLSYSTSPLSFKVELTAFLEARLESSSYFDAMT